MTIAHFIILYFIIVISLQLFFWLVVFGRLLKPQSTAESGTGDLCPDISILICAHNEAENLQQYLPTILNQTYEGQYEVVVVNDRSSDDTAQVLAALQSNYKHLNILNLGAQDGTGKKNALRKGARVTKFNYLTLIDADCIPNSLEWLSKLSKALKKETDFVLGYSPYLSQKSPYGLNLFIRHETTLTALQYLSAATWGLPYMGVGRNMLYRKTILEQSTHFEKHKHLLSGDDDLTVNEHSTKKNTVVCFEDKDTWVNSLPKASWSAYITQKRRHLSAGSYYKPLHKMMLGLFSLSHFLYWTLPIVAILSEFIGTLYFIFSLSLLARWLIYTFLSLKLGQRDLNRWFVVLDLAWCLYYIFFGFIIFFKPSPKTWE